MKNFIILITVTAFTFISSCSRNEQLLQPKILTGTGVLIGSVQLIRTSPEDPRGYDQSGVLVEVVGANITATSTAQAKDMYGKYVLTGLDSGTYTLRFSKNGYVSREISGVYHNGTDTTTMKYFTSDTNGTTAYNVVMLFEQYPDVSAKSITAEAQQTILVDTLMEHGTIREIRRDTSYSFISAITLDVNAQFDWSKTNYPLSYIAYIDDQSSVLSSRLPAKEIGDGDMYFVSELSNLKLPLGWYNFKLKPNSLSSNSLVNLSELQNVHRINLTNKTQLYLHIIPYADQKFSTVFYRKFDPPVEVLSTKKMRLSPISVPIQWK
ncbi:MAG: carboxypeptidase-like regulatory domain-containing protein [Bacteriodetes bacterium]|nr:carboxypeptidase-like regulatory domain-containing protein [Bacteroidota bacterium]